VGLDRRPHPVRLPVLKPRAVREPDSRTTIHVQLVDVDRTVKLLVGNDPLHRHGELVPLTDHAKPSIRLGLVPHLPLHRALVDRDDRRGKPDVLVGDRGHPGDRLDVVLVLAPRLNPTGPLDGRPGKILGLPGRPAPRNNSGHSTNGLIGSGQRLATRHLDLIGTGTRHPPLLVDQLGHVGEEPLGAVPVRLTPPLERADLGAKGGEGLRVPRNGLGAGVTKKVPQAGAAHLLVLAGLLVLHDISRLAVPVRPAVVTVVGGVPVPLRNRLTRHHADDRALSLKLKGGEEPPALQGGGTTLHGDDLVPDDLARLKLLVLLAKNRNLDGWAVQLSGTPVELLDSPNEGVPVLLGYPRRTQQITIMYNGLLTYKSFAYYAKSPANHTTVTA